MGTKYRSRNTDILLQYWKLHPALSLKALSHYPYLVHNKNPQDSRWNKKEQTCNWLSFGNNSIIILAIKLPVKKK